jgi:hypothetical protein
VIRNAVIHIQNEQPLLADLYEHPKPLDQGLVCTNVRTMDGKRPIFVDRSDSVFFFPYLHIRFIEIMAGAAGLPAIEAPSATGAQADTNGHVGAGQDAADAEADSELELDEDFLRRIREV